jgi:hypothetical protein
MDPTKTSSLGAIAAEDDGRKKSTSTPVGIDDT